MSKTRVVLTGVFQIISNGKLTLVGKIAVGKAPKRVAFAVTDSSGQVASDGSIY